MPKTAAPAEFYDRLFDNPATPFLHPTSESPYLAMYQAVVRLVPKGRSMVELGCGAGQLAEMVRMRARSYIGLDFSPAMIEQARRYVTGGDFRLFDLRTDPIPPADVYIATEVLEHLDDDLGLLARLPTGSWVILTVPSFDSESHVRTFPKPGDARRRYGDLLLIDADEIVERKPGVFFHVLRGVRS